MALASNKNAKRNYEIIEEFEAGLVLTGTEVKSISKSECSINEAYINITKNECFIINMYIKHFFEGNIYNVSTTRTRKLLLHKKEIIKLDFKKKKERLTIIPLKVYWSKKKIKILIALARGKKLHDKREDLKKEDLKKQMKYY